jgi:uncharacterized glyoxalase superfamily metalloenzyme YdcJ
MISQWQLRAAFAARLSDMYEREVLDLFALYEQQQNRSIARELEFDSALG